MSSPSQIPGPTTQGFDAFGSSLARTIFEGSAQGMIVLNPAGVVLALNSAFLNIYGLVQDDILGRPHQSFTDDVEVVRHGDDIGREVWVTTRALRGERVSNVLQLVRNRRSGREFYARCSATPHFEDGQFSATVIVVEDVTEATLAQMQLDAALSASEVGVWWIDVVQEKLWGDANFAKMYGLTAEEVQGGALARAYEVRHPDDRERVSIALRHATMTVQQHELEYRVILPDGEIRWLLSRGRSELNEEGQPIRRTGSTVDITRQKQAEEALRRTGETFENLVRNSPLGIYVVDADFRLALVSQGAQKVFENVRPLIGRDFSEVMRTVWAEPFASEAIRLFQHTLETGEPFHAPSTREQRGDRDEVESYDWKIEQVALSDGRFGVVCNFYNLSERQRMQEELEARVQERTIELTRANRDLDEFAYSVAHDLRSPLRTIVLTSRLLLESGENRLTDEEKEMLGRQSRGAVRLSEIVDDLLEFARLANAELRSEAIDMTELARITAQEALGLGWANPPTIHVQEGMRAQGDPKLIGYALINLLDNACKFSPNGGTVEVGEKDGTFFVQDEGVGFDMAYAPKLFVAFERLVDQKTFSGTGLGLANVRRIVERHGGRVWAESSPGNGATFRFTLS